MEQEKTTKTLEYSFIPFPSNMLMLGDNNTRSLLLLLIKKQNYWSNLDELDSDGYFYLTNNDIEDVLSLCNKTIRQALEGLFRSGVISIISTGTTGIREANKFKINFEKIIELERLTLEQCKMEKYKIHTVGRGEELSYRKNVEVPCTQAKTEGRTEVRTEPRTKCPTTLDNLYNINNKNILYNNIINKIYINKNINSIIYNLKYNNYNIVYKNNLFNLVLKESNNIISKEKEIEQSFSNALSEFLQRERGKYNSNLIESNTGGLSHFNESLDKEYQEENIIQQEACMTSLIEDNNIIPTRENNNIIKIENNMKNLSDSNLIENKTKYVSQDVINEQNRLCELLDELMGIPTDGNNNIIEIKEEQLIDTNDELNTVDLSDDNLETNIVFSEMEKMPEIEEEQPLSEFKYDFYNIELKLNEIREEKSIIPIEFYKEKIHKLFVEMNSMEFNSKCKENLRVYRLINKEFDSIIDEIKNAA